MDQVFILNQLAKFLKLINKAATKELRKELQAGHCFGFSLCYAVMTAEGKKEWWRAALSAIMAWDGSAKNLEEKIKLPQSDPNKRIRIHEIFERVLNYVVYHQADTDNEYEKLFRTEYMTQDSIFSAKEKHFKILSRGQTRCIEDYANAAGHFTHKDLAHTLEHAPITNNICLIKSLTHAISIGRDENGWWIYDPNYTNGKTEVVEKRMSSSIDVASEIIDILGHDICITIASFNDKKIIFPHHKLRIKHDILGISNGFGFIIFGNNHHEHIKVILEHIKKSNLAQKNVLSMLKQKVGETKNGLHHLVLGNRMMCEEIIKIIIKRQDGYRILARSFINQDGGSDQAIDRLFLYFDDAAILLADHNLLCVRMQKHCMIDLICELRPLIFEKIITELSENDRQFWRFVERLVREKRVKKTTLDMILQVKFKTNKSEYEAMMLNKTRLIFKSIDLYMKSSHEQSCLKRIKNQQTNYFFKQQINDSSGSIANELKKSILSI